MPKCCLTTEMFNIIDFDWVARPTYEWKCKKLTSSFRFTCRSALSAVVQVQCAAGTRRTARSPPTSCFKLSPPPQWALLLQRPCAPELCRSSTGGAERARCTDPTFTLLPRMETLRWRVSNWQSGYKVEPRTVDFNSKVSFSCTADFFFFFLIIQHTSTE